MANFPSSPTVGQTFTTPAGVTYVFTADGAWKTSQGIYAFGTYAEALAATDTTKSLAIREIARLIRDQPHSYVVAGGTTNAISVTLNPPLIDYVTGLTLRILTGGFVNTGAMTINANGIGAKSLTRLNGTAMVQGDVPADSIITAIYDGTAFRYLGASASDINKAVATNKSPFNITIVENRVRTVYTSLSGFQNFSSGTYGKKSSTSQLLVRGTTNLFSGGGTAAGQMRILVAGVEYIVICQNATASSNTPSPHGTFLITGLPLGATGWSIAFGRSDGLVWSSVINPNSTDTSNLPASTGTTLEFSEIEP